MSTVKGRLIAILVVYIALTVADRTDGSQPTTLIAGIIAGIIIGSAAGPILTAIPAIIHEGMRGPRGSKQSSAALLTFIAYVRWHATGDPADRWTATKRLTKSNLALIILEGSQLFANVIDINDPVVWAHIQEHTEADLDRYQRGLGPRTEDPEE